MYTYGCNYILFLRVLFIGLFQKALRQGQVPVRGVGIGAGRFKTPNQSVRQRVQLPRVRHRLRPLALAVDAG
jgi:hypothetical protein